MSDASSLQPCPHKEAYVRTVLNINHFATEGMIRMIVTTTDTDAVVPAVDDPKKKKPARKIWFPFGVWKNFNHIPAHQIASQRGPRPASALPKFYAITGCDTISFFAGKGKGSLCKVGQAYPEAKYVFLSLLGGPCVSDDSF